MRFSLKPLLEPQNARLMPPKVDPYATPLHRRIDALLIVITAITVAILLFTGSHGHAQSATHASAPTVGKLSR